MDYLKDNGKWIAFHTVTWCIAKVLFIAIKLWGISDAAILPSGVLSLFLAVACSGLIDGFIFGLIDSEFDKAFTQLGFVRRVLSKASINLAVGSTLTVVLIPLLLGRIPLANEGWAAETLELANVVISGVYILLITLALQAGKVAVSWLQTNDLLQIISNQESGIEEDRIFMFLDMKSSTRHAEKLGARKFSAMIQDCFQDMSKAARESDAEIYQFIGDEAVLTWPASGENFSKATNHYFLFREKIYRRARHYRERYGVVPEFKAGIHHGKVIRTHVGVVRKSIAFHGDTVNTASRIQGKCNELGRELLISSAVMENLCGTFKAHDQGKCHLRGKDQVVGLYSVSGPVRKNPNIHGRNNRMLQDVNTRKGNVMRLWLNLL